MLVCELSDVSGPGLEEAGRYTGSNNEYEHTILSPFQTRVLRNTLLQYQVQSAEFKQRNYNKHLTIRYKDPSVPTKRILHTTATPQAAPVIRVNKP